MTGFTNLGRNIDSSRAQKLRADQPDKKYINKKQKPGYKAMPKAAAKFLAFGICSAIVGGVEGLFEGMAKGAEGGVKVGAGGGLLGMIIGGVAGAGVGTVYSPMKAVAQFFVGGATAFNKEMREMKDINEEFKSKINDKFKEVKLNPLIDTITMDEVCNQLIEDIGEERMISKLDTIDNANKITGNENFEKYFKRSIDESISKLMTTKILENMPEIIDNYATTTKEEGLREETPIGFQCKTEGFHLGDYTMGFKKTDGKVTIETTQVSSNRTFTFELGTNDSGKHELKFIPKFNEIQYGEDGPLGPNILYNPESEKTDAHSAMKYALLAFTNDQTNVTTDAIYPAPPQETKQLEDETVLRGLKINKLDVKTNGIENDPNNGNVSQSNIRNTPEGE